MTSLGEKQTIKPLRIVIDMQGAQTESRFRGIGRYTMSFAQGIVRNSGEHEILLALSGLFPETIEPIRAAFDGLLPQENIRVWHAPGPVNEEQPGNDARRQVAELIREAFLASLQPDVIHITSLFEGYVDNAVTSIGRFDTHTPVSVSLYDLIPLINPENYLTPNPRYADYYFRKVDWLKQAACYLAISEYTKQEGEQYLPNQSKQFVNVSTAIDPQFQPQQIDAITQDTLFQKYSLTQPFILYTGGDDERKNLPRLIQAYAVLPASLRQNHQLLFAGKMSQGKIEKFQQTARAAGLSEDELLFTGYVSDQELIQLYTLCKLYVFPSWHEGFGLPALEAMACGAPVIGANTSSLPEVIGLDEALFDPLEVPSMAAKLQQALSDEVFLNRLRKHSLHRAKRFSWDETAKQAIISWEQLPTLHAQTQAPAIKPGRKPRLAFVSPLPPERSGIADYSAELLPALAEHYEIEVVVAQEHVDDAWIKGHCNIRNVSWLRQHAREIDRVLYQVGNSPFHQHMLDLLQEIPGTVVLHDFYLSGLMSWLELHGGDGNVWTRALYEAHGYEGVGMRYLDAEAAKRDYPVNWAILQQAQGVIVHSDYSRQLARQWVGNGFADDWNVIPLLRKPAATFDKLDAKKRLGFSADDFIICSFGFLDTTKLNHRVLDCWLASALARDERCHLIFVGENHGGDYGFTLLQTIKRSGLGKRIRITGFASPEDFRQHLQVADMAVQLRTHSRGETSAAVLDCMNYALPLIVNANGSMAELEPEAVWMLPDGFKDSALIEALETLWREPEKRRELGKRAKEIILTQHSPVECALNYAEAIERFHLRGRVGTASLINVIAEQGGATLGQSDLFALSKAISTTLPLERPAKRLFLDVTATSRNDLKTGIERVSRALLLALLNAPPSGYRIEPVYLDQVNGLWCHRYARRYMLGLLDCPSEVLDDELVEPECGDVFLGLDLTGDTLVQAVKSGLFANYRNQGVTIHQVVFDLLPVQKPEVFPPGADVTHQRWLAAISTFDGALCISKAVADAFSQWQTAAGFEWLDRRPYQIGWFHLGGDLRNSVPSLGFPKNAESLIGQLKARPCFLMVGTIEPRKGYLQTIEAFTKLWRDNADLNLVIIGKEGWRGLQDDMRRNIPETVECLRGHAELNKRLFWLEGISDEYLEKIYAASTCLIAASYGEGFGLPLIEAAQHKLPIIARDIPIFREVAGKHAYYFKTESPHTLAFAIRDWLGLYQTEHHINSGGIPMITWKESAKQLIDAVIYGKWPIRVVSERLRKKAIDQHLRLIHEARISMVSNLLPKGDVILDLGGANCPLYKMGYPHKFKKLYLIDLPPEKRCDMYKEIVVDPDCDGGEVVIKYGDMTQLDEFADGSVDFVWSGQSIEHVPLEAGRKMCEAAYRVLKPGGFFCLDTPNRLITRIHTQDIGGGFIHPEHYLEYEPEQLRGLLVETGFTVHKVFGVCEMNASVQSGHFDYMDFLYGQQITDNVEDSYIQYFHCVKS
jgi:glycosyltransferase involved in cell wall biosynthesis/SAM-dependent methyltransferase